MHVQLNGGGNAKSWIDHYETGRRLASPPAWVNMYWQFSKEAEAVCEYQVHGCAHHQAFARICTCYLTSYSNIQVQLEVIPVNHCVTAIAAVAQHLHAPFSSVHRCG
jgi:hypothetical protein